VVVATIQDLREVNRSLGKQGFLTKNLRHLGVYVAWVALRLGILPIHVTLANVLLAITCCIVMAVGTPSSRWMGILIIIMWQLLDTVDGTMARATLSRSNYGGFVDELAGMILTAFIPISIGLGLYFHPEGSIQQLFNRLGSQITYLPTHSLAAGAFGSVAALSMRLIHRIIMVRFKLDLAKRRRSLRGPLGKLADAVKALEGLGGGHIIILVTSVAFARLEWYVFYYLFLSSGMLVVSIIVALLSLRHEHAYPSENLG